MSGDQFELFLTEARAGWLESRIVLNESHYDLSVSANFSEPLKDLCSALCDIHGLSELPTRQDIHCHHEFEWGGEGWLYFWKLTPQPNDTVHVSIEFKGKREVGGIEYPVWDIDVLVPWRTLAEQVFTQVCAMLRMYGFIGYLERWSKEFPAAHMVRLGHLLHGRSGETHDFSHELSYLAVPR